MIRKPILLALATLAIPFAAACSTPAEDGSAAGDEQDINAANCEEGYSLQDANKARDEAARLAQVRIDAKKGKGSVCAEDAYVGTIVDLIREASMCKSVAMQINNGGTKKDGKPGWVIREGLKGTLGVAAGLGKLYSYNAGTIAKELAGEHSKAAPVELYAPAQGAFGNEEILVFASAEGDKGTSKDVTIKTLTFDDAGNPTYDETPAKYWVSEEDGIGIVLTVTDEKSPAKRYILSGSEFVREGAPDPSDPFAEPGEGFVDDGSATTFSIYPSECEA